MNRIELEIARRQLFLTATECSKYVSETSEQAWRRWEAGTREVPRDVIERMTDLLRQKQEAISVAIAEINDQRRKNLKPFCVWYKSHEDMPGKPSVIVWRLSQAVCGAMYEQYGVRVVPFEREKYLLWAFKSNLNDTKTNTKENHHAWLSREI